MRKLKLPKKNGIIFFAAFFIYIAAFIFNNSVKQGAVNGIGICLNSIVPSLFPMLIISSFLTNVGIPQKIKRIIFYPIKKIIGVSENAAESFIFGSTAGYPVGVKTAYSLYKQKKLSLQDAQRSALINVNPGIAFSVIVSGKVFFGSSLSGITLYLSVTAANFLTGILLKKRKNADTSKTVFEENSMDASLCLINAVSSSVKGIASICAWITAFSAFSAPLGEMIKMPYIKIFLEVTSASALCAENGLLPLCALAMGFGGLCVFFQLMPEIKDLKISPVKYLFYRLVSGIISFIIESIIINFIPVQTTVFSPDEAIVRFNSVSVSGSLALIFLCSVFMLSIYSNYETNTCHTKINMLK
ncbi:MAG: hypothetical protein J1E34_05455 [Oscillospiraceae bacterium]|nr:hypothetical protein [Oscillospiraceae bacterium]